MCALQKFMALYCSSPERITSFLETLVEVLDEVQDTDSEDTEVELNTIISIRYYLERNDNCPDDKELQNNLVSTLVQSFNSDNWKILEETASALGIFANGTEKQANLVIQYNAIPHFLNLLSSDKEELQRQGILSFMGIMGHGPKYREYCIKAGLVKPLLDLIEDTSKVSIEVLYDVAVMMYYICQDGKPIVPYETVVQILPAIKKLIDLKSDHEKMDGILISAIGSLGFIGRSGFSRVPLIVDANFVEKIIPFLHHSHSDVQKMTIFAINKIMDGNDTFHRHVIVEHGMLKHLHILLDHPSDIDIIGDALEFLIHAIVPNETHVKEVFDEGNLMPLVIKAFEIHNFKIQIRAIEVLLVTFVKATVEQIEFLVENGVVPAICKHMQILSFDSYEGAVENVLDTLLHLAKKGKESTRRILEELNKCGGMDLLENLTKSDNFNIRFMAGNIVKTITSSAQKVHMEL